MPIGAANGSTAASGVDASAYKSKHAPGDVVHGYTLAEQLGVGRYGVVFRAQRKADAGAAPVVLKLPRHFPEAVQSMVNEYEVLSAIMGSAHIVALRDSFVVSGARVIALEWIDGGDMHDALGELIEERRHFSVEQLRGFYTQLVEGLAHIHRKGFSHADIKPENMLIDAARSRVKYCDLGHAEKMGEWSLAEPPVMSSEYRPPEVLFERKPYTQAIDVWALVCTLFELATRYPLIEIDDEGSDSEGSEGDKDEWESDDERTVAEKDAADYRQTTQHLARLQALFGVDFVPPAVRKLEQAYFDAKGVLRGEHKPAKSQSLLDKLRRESRLGLPDATAAADMIKMALAYAARDRADCEALLSHPWLKIESQWM